MEELFCYHVDKIPDTGDPVNRVIAGGDVSRAIRECNEHLLRTLVTYPAGSATLCFVGSSLRCPVLPSGKRA